jgi:Icc-related predicted phosphoesterase
MRICAVSDLHDNLIDIPECDLLLIGGDICPDFHYDAEVKQAIWLNTEFRKWLDRIPAEHVVGIAGNHDFVFENRPSIVPKDLRWTYLQDESAVVNGVKIHGSPWQPPFFDWAFNATEDKLALAFDLIDEDTDIVICHGPPYGQGDRTRRGENVGSKSLLKRLKVVQPKHVVCGHIHEGYGHYRVGDTRVHNASVVNLFYDVVNEPMLFDL